MTKWPFIWSPNNAAILTTREGGGPNTHTIDENKFSNHHTYAQKKYFEGVSFCYCHRSPILIVVFIPIHWISIVFCCNLSFRARAQKKKTTNQHVSSRKRGNQQFENVRFQHQPTERNVWWKIQRNFYRERAKRSHDRFGPQLTARLTEWLYCRASTARKKERKKRKMAGLLLPFYFFRGGDEK